MLSLRRYSERELLIPWERNGSVSGILTKSTWSLGLIAKWRKDISVSFSPVIFFPDFFCDSALSVVKKIGCQVVFYSIEENGLADIGKLREQCSSNHPDLIVMVHFFGTANNQATQFREIANMHQAWLIEDCAHSVSPVGLIGSVGDFSIFSPHKLIPIPFGAVLSVRNDGPCKLDAAVLSSFGDPLDWARQIHESVSSTKITSRSLQLSEIIWVIKRSMQRLGLARKSRVIKTSRSRISSIEVGLVGPRMSWFSKRMLGVLVSKPKSNLLSKFMLPGVPSLSHLDRISAIRQSNLPIWDEVVAILSNGQVVPALINPIPNIPYLAAYCGDEHDVLNVLTEMERLGLPVCTWPDLPEVVHGDISTHKGAINLRNRRIYLPLHHNIDASGISRLLAVISKSRKIAVDSVKLVEVTSPEVWRSYLMKIEFSNLLQAWEYGEAKSLSEGWRIRRVVCSINGKPIGVAQFLVRKIFGTITVSRLSRGPLFFDNSSSFDLSLVWQKMSESYSLRKLHILSISPEIIVGNSPIHAHGFATLMRISPVGTESATLNLDQDISTLRQNLEQKWRNQLAMSERSGTHVEYSTDETDFDWFEEVYETLRREKDFYGIPPILFKNISKTFLRTANAHLFIGNYEGRKIAAVLMVTHGTTATYLAGWNGAEGRKLNVNNLLLWEASLRLKEMGFGKLDLGGIDILNTPTIAKFKMGMRGENYKTVGEFVKLL
jgi:lipid II:glycine glycyltransferase (peptidoglycan interpeptide bridge formation enzyme)